jgi:hypothetical protein
MLKGELHRLQDGFIIALSGHYYVEGGKECAKHCHLSQAYW